MGSGLNIDMSSFSSKFNLFLEADLQPALDKAPAKETAPKTDREALASELETTTPEDFDVHVAKQQDEIDPRKIEQIKKLQHWIHEMDSFVKFLNGTDEGSLQYQLNAAPEESLFGDIARTEKKKISRLAADLSGMTEGLKGYLLSANE